ncbi:unnamed protein product [Zymoseptoria tritici ST99CH_1E4]|uniref:Uncharacterized protein n=1 Tax=Zymoseptoria tritici ST99CH_1E4 TaxID=1276532 RepID=A0A2H1FN26_ZYMTR|nr:unnamed protein product [Zymoseptoria tritici ST99CH_1E4]
MASTPDQGDGSTNRRTTRSMKDQATKPASIPATSKTLRKRGPKKVPTVPARPRRTPLLAGGHDEDQQGDGNSSSEDLPGDEQVPSDEDYESVGVQEKRKAGSKGQNHSDETPRKRRRTRAPAISAAPPRLQAAATSLDVENIGITVDETTTILNQFINLVVELGLREKQSAQRRYTPSFEQAQHVLDLPPWKPDERFFEFMVDSVVLVPHVQPDGTNTQRWRMLARNNLGKEVELFLMPAVSSPREACPDCLSQENRVNCGRTPTACKRCTTAGREALCAQEISAREARRFAIITQDVCSEKHKIVDLGQIAVQAMNNAPFDLKLPAWARFTAHNQGGPPPTAVSHEQSFITVTSLLRWKEQHWNAFDFRTLPILGDVGKSSGEKYGSAFSTRWLTRLLPTTLQGKTTVRLANLPAVWSTDRLDFHIQGVSLASSAARDSDAISAANFNAAEYPFLGEGPGDDASDDTKAFQDVYKMSALRLVGLVGTEQAIRDRWEEITSAFMIKKRGTARGPYNKGKIWKISSTPGHKTQIIPARALLRNVTVDGSSESLERNLRILTTIDDAACLAWIVQQSLDSLAKGEGLLQILLSAFIAAQCLELGLVTKEEVLESYCDCEDETEEAQTEHHCTSCWTIRACSHLSKHTTEDGRLLKCKGCAGRNFVRSSGRGQSSVSALVERASERILKLDAKFHSIHWTSKEFADLILKAHGTEDDKIFHDSYANKNVSIKDAIWPPQYRLRAFCFHPRQVSVEKPYSRCIRQDGSVGLHDPVANAVLEPVGVNIWKSTDPPSMLPLMKKALQLRLHVKDRLPCEGYYDDVRADWDLLERAFDTQRVVASLAPRTRASRVSSGEADLAYLGKCLPMEKSGIWDGVTAREGQFKRMYKLLDKKHPDFSIDDQYWDWDVLMQDIEDMENDIRPDGFNPHGLRLPRRGLHNIPWLWRKDLCPQDSDFDEAYIFNEFSARLYMLDFFCDRMHKTEESPATLFLEYVAQWFESGGKCHIFGCILTLLRGHLSRFSFGRGLVQRRRMEDGGPRRIQAGDHLRTGCTKLLPRNMATDYDISRRTVLVESWKANLLRWHYPNLPGLVEDLEQMILDLQDSCEWYGPISTDPGAYDKVPLPSHAAEWAAAMEAQVRPADEIVQPDPEDSFDDSELDELEDDEAAMYQAHQKRVEAIKSTLTTDGLRSRYIHLRETAQNLGCVDHKFVSDLLNELSGLLENDGEEGDGAEGDDDENDDANVPRLRSIIQELEEYMEGVIDARDPADMTGPSQTSGTITAPGGTNTASTSGAPQGPTSTDNSLEAQTQRLKEGQRLLKLDEERFAQQQLQGQQQLDEQQRLLQEERQAFTREKQEYEQNSRIRELQQERQANAKLKGRIDGLAEALALQRAELEKRDKEIAQELMVLSGDAMEE